MFYWFKRGNELVRYEAREISRTQYELTILGADGVEHIEHFDTADDLHDRQVAFERELAEEGWTGPHGWNI